MESLGTRLDHDWEVRLPYFTVMGHSLLEWVEARSVAMIIIIEGLGRLGI